MSSTFNTPIRIFKRNNPTNDGTIAPDNTGAAICSQEAAVVGGVATTVVVPAGSIIHSITGYFTTAAAVPASTDVDLVSDSVVSTTIAALNDAAGVNAGVLDAAAAGVLLNVGINDATISYTAGADAEGVISVVYTARNPNGTITPVGNGYTNN